MPIRFRCAYCNQLMSIARRKAGTIVTCTKCKGQVIVPSPAEQPVTPPEPKGPQLFEEADIDEVFGKGNGKRRSRAAPQVEPERPSLRPRSGIFLGPLALTILTIVVLALLGGAFYVGMLVGSSG